MGWGWGVGVVTALLVGAPLAAQAGRGARLDCDRCHGELEFMRQQVGRLDRARELLAPAAVVAASVHGELRCSACHAGFDRYPHPERGTATQSCRSCHADAEAEWLAGAHAGTEGRDLVACSDCHSVHAVRPAAALAQGAAMHELNARCTDCHDLARLPHTDPHVDAVPCSSCHAAHAVHAPASAASLLTPERQGATCGACHEAEAASWAADVHGRGLAGERAVEYAARPAAERGAGCTGCHGGHGIMDPAVRPFAVEATNRCSGCHEDRARTFYYSYHGKATALGSRVAAACHSCHGGHGVFPEDDPRSTVHPANLVETCGSCHAYARPAFVRYDSHPDPLNRQRNPYLFYSFVFMNALLVGVLTVFGLHTLLWWVRLRIDARRGHGHGGTGAGSG
jgi:hypothetical protein